MKKPEILSDEQIAQYMNTPQAHAGGDDCYWDLDGIVKDQRDADFQDMIRQFNSLLDNLDIEKELNNYSEEAAKGWFLALNRIRGKLNNENL